MCWIVRNDDERSAITESMRAMVLVTLLVTSCTKTNPNLCCVDEADCTSHGIAPGSTCSDGLVCRGNQCIAETCASSANCEAAAPYCLANQLCAPACDDNEIGRASCRERVYGPV